MISVHPMTDNILVGDGENALLALVRDLASALAWAFWPGRDKSLIWERLLVSPSHSLLLSCPTDIGGMSVRIVAIVPQQDAERDGSPAVEIMGKKLRLVGRGTPSPYLTLDKEEGHK